MSDPMHDDVVFTIGFVLQQSKALKRTSRLDEPHVDLARKIAVELERAGFEITRTKRLPTSPPSTR